MMLYKLLKSLLYFVLFQVGLRGWHEPPLGIVLDHGFVDRLRGKQLLPGDERLFRGRDLIEGGHGEGDIRRATVLDGHVPQALPRLYSGGFHGFILQILPFLGQHS